MPVLPSADSATLVPNQPSPASPLPVSFDPSWVNAVPEWVNTHTAPMRLLSGAPPISAVLPLAESATLPPNSPAPTSPLPVSFAPSWVQVVPERVNTHAAPTLVLSCGPPIRVVLPLEESATSRPNSPAPTSPLPVSGPACLVQVLPERVNTHTPPTPVLYPGPPTTAVLPSPERATLAPNSIEPVCSVTSFCCCVQVPSERVKIQTAPRCVSNPAGSPGPPMSAVLPSEDSATLDP